MRIFKVATTDYLKARSKEAYAILNRHKVPHVESSVDPDTTKAIEWSYPTSENARHFGFAEQGCWTVQYVYRNCGRLYATKAIAGFVAKTEAIAYARSLPTEWCSLNLAYHPEYKDPKGGAQ